MKKLLLLICGIIVVSSCRKTNVEAEVSTVNPTEDTSQFVTLTDVVPDAILEIRYFGTYNFVGDRIDGYLEPTALLNKQPTASALLVTMSSSWATA